MAFVSRSPFLDREFLDARDVRIFTADELATCICFLERVRRPQICKVAPKLYIEGKLQTSSWEDRQSGEKRFRTEIVARDIVLLGTPDGPEHRTRYVDEEREPVVAGAGEITDEDIPF